MDDLPHRNIEAAWRVHAQYDQRGALVLRFLETPVQVVGRGRPDRSLDIEQNGDLWFLGQEGAAKQYQG